MRLISFFLCLIYFTARILTMGTITTIDVHKIADRSSLWTNGRLQTIRVKPGYGHGYLSMAKSFQSGISLAVQDFSLNGKGPIQLTGMLAAPSIISFCLNLSGLRNLSYTKNRVFLGNAASIIDFDQYTPCISREIKNNIPVQSLAVSMEPAVFSELTGKSSRQLIESLYLLDRDTAKPNNRSRSKQLDFAQQICGFQMFNSFMNDPHDTFYLETKSLELVALQLKQLDFMTGETPQEQVFNHHVENISYACEILRKEMENPPGALELARRVGLNHHKLVKGFKQMIGVNPFDYLRIIRLEKARNLIASRECNVTEAAFCVGYSSLSHFSKSFREEFGITPKYAAKK